MVKTCSTMLPLDSLLPFFDLPIVDQKIERADFVSSTLERVNSNMFKKKPLLVMVLCAHCPFVKNIESALKKLENEFVDKIDFLAVSSNSEDTHPQDAPRFLAKQKAKNQWLFPYVFDFDQSFAKALRAACTPDFFLFSPDIYGNQRLIYRGQLDDSRPGNDLPPSGADLRRAIQATLSFKDVVFEQKPSIGCNIKWAPGFEPSWFNEIGH